MGHDIDDIDDDTTIYVRTEDGSFNHVGRFSSEDELYAALEKQYDGYVGNLTIFSTLGSYTLPRPFNGYSERDIETIQDIVGVFEDSPYVSGASLAGAGGASHVTRLDSKINLSAKEYDFLVTMTPDEEAVNTDTVDAIGPFAAQFDALAAELDLDDVAEFVAGTTYLPKRGARQHNTRLYGRYVPADPDAPLAVQCAARAHGNVADAFPVYDFRTGYHTWMNSSGDLYDSMEGVDLLVMVDEGRESIMPNDVEEYDLLTSSSTPFEYDELVDILTPVVDDLDDAVDASVTLEAVGVQTVMLKNVGDLPVAGLNITVSDSE